MESSLEKLQPFKRERSMKIGSLWCVRDFDANWLWYHLFASTPVDNDVVVILGLEHHDQTAAMLVMFTSMITGENDFMQEEDFLKTFKPKNLSKNVRASREKL